MARPHVLITGFGPFPGAAENSSAWLVETLAASRPSSRLNCTLHAEVLPTEWAEVATLGPRLFNQHRPRVMLHLGLNKRARGFRIERTARNLIDPNEDARGAVPSTRSVLERGRALLDRMVGDVQELGHAEGAATFEGRNMMLVLAPNGAKS